MRQNSMVVIETINKIGYGSKVSIKGMADVIVIPAAIILSFTFDQTRSIAALPPTQEPGFNSRSIRDGIFKW